ncbi:MAG: biotin--[acetyl-CoA-carboxylase] ligase, partial [Williamsia herbipolensis]|nr:biotin--[acetyl-CoA-carboxylase] ligase [Williamsia herbipolensis]
RPGDVLIAQRQDAGKGRLGRRWQAPYGSSQIMSVLLRPTAVPLPRRGWIGAILGLALRAALGEQLAVTVDLKWPNDLLVDGRKCGGILAELVGDAVVVGAGVNLDVAADEFPPREPGSTALLPISLIDASGVAALDRVALAAATLREFGRRVRSWESAGGDVVAAGLLAEYRAACTTLGQRVRLELPEGRSLTGLAQDVGPDGSIHLRSDDGRRTVHSAGDVVHLRQAEHRPAEHRPAEHRPHER